ncbi:MAG: YbhB/YbcL family Raf kinase inhibitor-like protein [Buchananella hordeovulneris]|nr:YbhB/YbcL family Raf kinase inhibitor-like protein [Buchananella hordeovulneris]
MNLERPIAPDPYSLLPQVPSFTLTSEDFEDGGRLPDAQVAHLGNTSPQLSWSGFPAATRSFLVTCIDPDAPTPAPWWHWMIVDLDAGTTELPAGVGASDLLLDGAAYHARMDGGTHSYEGAAPPPGDRPHRYIFAVTALDVDTLELDDDASPTLVTFMALEHTIARATLTAHYSH